MKRVFFIILLVVAPLMAWSQRAATTNYYNTGPIPITSGSFLFDASSEYMVSSDASLLNAQIKGTGQKFSISIWCKRNVIDATYQTIFSRDSNTGHRQIACEFTPEEFWSFFIADDGTNYSWWKTTAAITNTNNWYHIVQTFDNTLALASKCKIYINGVLETTVRTDGGAGVSNVNNQPTEPIYINLTNFGGLINPFKGYSGRITFYNAGILTQSDVTALFNNGLGRDDRFVGTSVAPYMQWNPGMSTFSINWTMDDLVGTTYPTSKAFVSGGLVFSDLSRTVVPESGLFYHSASSTLFSNMTAMPSLRDKFIIDAFIQNSDNDGTWALMDAIWFPAAHDQQAARLNWKNPAGTTLSETSSPTWALDQGYTGNGTTSYLKTGFNPTASGVNYTLNSACIGAYTLINADDASVSIGVIDTNGSLIVPKNAGAFAGRLNGTVNQTTAGVTNTLGLINIRRTASNAQAVYKNGASVATGSGASVAVPNREFYLLANNNGGTAGSFSSNQLAHAFISSGSINQAAHYLRVTQYLRSKGNTIFP